MHIMADTKISTRRRRRAHSIAFKRELVARSLEPGVSVSAIALEAGINANLLFAWRRAHLRLAVPAVTCRASSAGERTAVLLPVEVVAPGAASAATSSSPTAPRPAAAPSTSGSIEIEVGAARIRLRGAIDPASLRCVFELLGSR
ncbi:IS66-like element accessory protein TnpA [Piscinibacter koreensis]